MNIILTEIGFFGPVILFLFIIYLVNSENCQKNAKVYSSNKEIASREKCNNKETIANHPDIYAYLFFWQALNYALNEILKRLIQEPRPADIAYINTWDSAPNIGPYGMPSGHAQQVVSETTFIALAFKNPFATFVATCIALLTMYQRYIYQKHTILQLAVGSIVGIITGSSFYIFLSHQI
tara:strand:+ start:336 stop:875 length:540 start_codon:yes stop_codon:yes gene_type:complete